uniref:Uncharacterized protein n=1 Tax=Arundo donax TaxID=35708 RepID=A0A0A8YKK3_ARUDO
MALSSSSSPSTFFLISFIDGQKLDIYVEGTPWSPLPRCEGRVACWRCPSRPDCFDAGVAGNSVQTLEAWTSRLGIGAAQPWYTQNVRILVWILEDDQGSSRV